MNRAAFLFVLVGFAAGLAVGLWLQPRETPRTSRGRTVAEELSREAPPVAPDESPKRSVDETEVVEPTERLSPEDAEANEGFGRIEVDFAGFDGAPVAWTSVMTMSGSRNDDQFLPDGGTTVAVFDAVPGVYDVWWLRGPQRIGTRVRVDAGRAVRLRAAEYDQPLVPSGLAVLGLRIHASWGGYAEGAEFTVDAPDDGMRGRTDAHGCASLTLRPGRYTVQVGALQEQVTVTAGDETVLEIQHRGQGDLLFDPPDLNVTARLRLRRVGNPALLKRLCRHAWLGTGRLVVGFLYVEAGEYEVVSKYHTDGYGGSVLGSARVFPGKPTTFAVRLPTGGIKVYVERPHEAAAKAPYILARVMRREGDRLVYVDHIQVVRHVLSGEYRYRASIGALPPGTYRVECLSVGETVEVGGKIVRIDLRLAR